MTIGMLVIKFRFVFVFVVLIVLTNAQRRIKDGKVVEAVKKYVVYLLKAPVSPQKYDAWVCGGALVSTEFIITSAACVEDVEHLYAIAGYNKYVPVESIQADPCTRDKKKKVIYICVPKDYELDYEKLEKWAHIDIAVVKVESPYDFTDISYEHVCSYLPGKININYEHRYQAVGVETLAYGWGHAELWRNPNDGENHNQEQLHYASALIMDKTECKAAYSKFHRMDALIDKYMICTLEPGSFDDAGRLTDKTEPKLLEGCVTRTQRLHGMKGKACYEPYREGEYYYEDGILVGDETRRYGFNMSQDYRRNGICQNDHGGPLVTWVGSQELLIGVASVFRVDADYKCAGPYLYTSTQCNGAFLGCLLGAKSGRRDSCDAPPAERGFDMIERQISWIGHPDGPAENEIEQFSKQVLRTQQMPDQESREFSDLQRQLPDRSIRGQRFRTQELLEQQLSDQQLPEIPLEEIIPGLHLPQLNLPGLFLPDQESEEHEIKRPTYDYGQPSEERFVPYFNPDHRNRMFFTPAKIPLKTPTPKRCCHACTYRGYHSLMLAKLAESTDSWQTKVIMDGHGRVPRDVTPSLTTLPRCLQTTTRSCGKMALAAANHAPEALRERSLGSGHDH